MNTSIEEINGKKIIRFGKNLTIYVISEIKKEITDCFSEDINFEIDLGSVEECDTAGIQLLVSLLKTAEQKKKRLVFLNISEVTAQVAKKLAIDLDKSSSIKEVLNAKNDNDGR
jgi:anti-anti-sigma factor